ncbi:hypothetical protein ACLB2K_013548 [Fragaria x ananassa]
MHAKSDSEVTMSVEQSTPPRSPSRRPIYYVQSPSNHDAEKMSYGSSPMGSPGHPAYYHCSPIHHSRESSTSRYSASLKNPRYSAWKRLHRPGADSDSDPDDQNDEVSPGRNVRLYLCFLFLFVFLFTLFSLILWGASKSYKPHVLVKAGVDNSGLATDMLSLNSTVRIHYRNPGTFFGVHVTSTPLELHYYQLKVASGQIEKFYQARKTHRTILTVVRGSQVSLYGGISALDVRGNHEKVAVPLNLTFVVRSRAYILGKLVKSKFYRRIRCSVTLRGSNLGKHSNLTESCVYH